MLPIVLLTRCQICGLQCHTVRLCSMHECDIWLVCRNTLLHSTQKAYVEIRAGPEDDMRGLSTVAFRLLTGRSVADELLRQLAHLTVSQREAVYRKCRQIEGVANGKPYSPDSCVQATVAEYLGFIKIKEVPPPDHLSCCL
jgi:hypothetical protein